MREAQKQHQARSNNSHGPSAKNIVESFECLGKCSFVDLTVDSRTPPSQQRCVERGDVAKEGPPTLARPIRKTIKYFEDLLTNQSTGMKRQLRGEMESPAKYARIMGSNGKGLLKNYMVGGMEYIHAKDRMDGYTYDGGLSGSSLSPSSDQAL